MFRRFDQVVDDSAAYLASPLSPKSLLVFRDPSEGRAETLADSTGIAAFHFDLFLDRIIGSGATFSQVKQRRLVGSK